MSKQYTVEELHDLIQKKGEPILVKMIEGFRDIPQNTTLWFSIFGTNTITPYGHYTNNKNEKFNYSFDYAVYFDDEYNGKFELINKEDDKSSLTNKNMNIKEKFNQLFLKEPEKSFRKVGITDESDILTEDGQNIFLSWLLKQKGEQFKKEIVDKLLEEDKKEDK